ncbi:MAG: hypothetical protein AAFU73_07170 [Planctomycetota bacterium]
MDVYPEFAAGEGQTHDWTVDTVVVTQANLVFLTTGPAACATLGLLPNQVALTPLVALRVADVLWRALEATDEFSRADVVREWQLEERVAVPHGRVVVEPRAAHIGIEPLGSGVLVSVLWEHVPALAWQLEAVARPLSGVA